MTFNKFAFLLFLPAFFLLACEDDDVIDIDDEELITDLNIELVPQGGGATVMLSFSDPDGSGGGTAPTITGGTLAANTTYIGTVTLTNASETPAEDITAEIMEEDDEHQFFYQPSAGLNLAVFYGDQDDQGNPVGLTAEYQAGAASTGNLIIILRHEPIKDAQGVKDGDITNAGGETDIEVTFPIEIQ